MVILGGDLSLSCIVRFILGSERCWSAVASFCEKVVALKEAAELQREADIHADPGDDQGKGHTDMCSFSLRNKVGDNRALTVPMSAL